MKQWLPMLLILLLILSGCQSPSQDHVTFYYSRDPAQYQYFESDGVIQAEVRDLSGHRDDLRYLMGLYLAGPLEEGLIAPFPRTTRLQSVYKTDNHISIELSDHTDAMTDVEFSLACACLTKTCLCFEDCETVTIVSGSRSVTMDSASILLYDTLPTQETEVTQ